VLLIATQVVTACQLEQLFYFGILILNPGLGLGLVRVNKLLELGPESIPKLLKIFVLLRRDLMPVLTVH
jgi:hypothetical protein